MKAQFKYYLHDNYTSNERADFILNELEANGVFAPVDMEVEEFAELIGRPFYEVELTCELDTDTGRIEILSAKA